MNTPRRRCCSPISPEVSNSSAACLTAEGLCLETLVLWPIPRVFGQWLDFLDKIWNSPDLSDLSRQGCNQHIVTDELAIILPELDKRIGGTPNLPKRFALAVTRMSAARKRAWRMPDPPSGGHDAGGPIQFGSETTLHPARATWLFMCAIG